MNERIGHISFYDSKQSEYGFSKPYSEDTAKIIDEEVKKIVADAYSRTIKLLTNKKAEVETLAQELLAKEILFQSDLEGLIGPRPFEKQTTYEAFTNNNGKSTVETEEKEDEEVVAKTDEAVTETTSEDSTAPDTSSEDPKKD
jgi:cell division protease FtsH